MSFKNSDQPVNHEEETRLKALTHKDLIEELEVHLDNTSYSSLQGELSIRFMQSILLLNQCVKLIVSLAADNDLNKREVSDLLESLTAIHRFTKDGGRNNE